jgi:threonine aldolase
VLDPRIEAVRKRCTHFLSGHRSLVHGARAALRDLADSAAEDALSDLYGEGDLVSGFEREMASLLGKESAVFLPTGTMAQQIAARLWADRKGPRAIGFHPLCHLEHHEHRGYQALHGLRGVPVGPPHALLTAKDLSQVAEPLSLLLIELPQRELGGLLPTWEELASVVAAARERNIALHLDGARLWESGPFYGRPYAEIAGLFDSVYVSFYKGLGALAGCVLAGPESFVAEARVWQRRHGGNVVHLYPYVVSARAGVARHLGRMPEYVAKARSIAARLSALPRIEIVPDPPHTNMMHLYLEGPRERLDAAVLAVAEETGTWLCTRLRPTPLPSRSVLELNAGLATLALSDDRIVELFELLLRKASA